MIVPIFDNGQLCVNSINKNRNYSKFLVFAEKIVYLP